jgi:hypothetical protein
LLLHWVHQLRVLQPLLLRRQRLPLPCWRVLHHHLQQQQLLLLLHSYSQPSLLLLLLLRCCLGALQQLWLYLQWPWQLRCL